MDTVERPFSRLMAPLPDKGCGSDETSIVTMVAYSINNLEPTLGLSKGCAIVRAPFIIQLSEGARKYTDKRIA